MSHHIITGNRLTDGRVVVLTATGWAPPPAKPLRLPKEDAEVMMAACTQAEGGAAAPVVGVYVVAVGADGLPELLRERIRLTGPTVRPDLAVA